MCIRCSISGAALSLAACTQRSCLCTAGRLLPVRVIAHSVSATSLGCPQVSAAHSVLVARLHLLQGCLSILCRKDICNIGIETESNIDEHIFTQYSRWLQAASCRECLSCIHVHMKEVWIKLALHVKERSSIQQTQYP